MNKTEIFLRKNSSTILTVIGATGVIATSILSVRATPKALKLIEDERQRRKEYKTIFADNEPYETVIIPDLTRMEMVKIAWKPYIPAIVTGLSTIACIFGANYLSTRNQASLMSAYALLDNYFKEYREKTKEISKDKDVNFEHEIIKSKFNPDMEIDEDKELFFDYQSMQYFESTFEQVKRAEDILNRKLSSDGFACLNDFYDILGIPHVAYGYQLGWSIETSDRLYGHSGLEFEFEKVEMEGGLECNIMTINYPASIEYTC